MEAGGDGGKQKQRMQAEELGKRGENSPAVKAAAVETAESTGYCDSGVVCSRPIRLRLLGF